MSGPTGAFTVESPSTAPQFNEGKKHKALSSLTSPLPNENGSNSWRRASIGNSPSCPSSFPHPPHCSVSSPRDS